MGRLARDEEEGLILEDGKRIISFRIETWLALIDRVFGIAGPKITKVLLEQIGNEIGNSSMAYSKSQLQGEESLAKVLDEVLLLRGWGRCRDFEKRIEDGKAIYRFRLNNTPFTHERKSTQPVCDMMRGIVEGWLETYLGRKAAGNNEISCAAMGHAFCSIEIVFTR